MCETVVSFTVAGCYIMFHVSSCLFLLFLRLLRPPRTNPKPTMTRATPFVSFPPRRSGNATARRSRAAWRAPTSSARPWRRSSPGTPRSPRLLGERSAERRAERRAERSAECVKPARVEHGRVWRFCWLSDVVRVRVWSMEDDQRGADRGGFLGAANAAGGVMFESPRASRVARVRLM